MPDAFIALATQFSSLNRLPETEHDEKNSFTYDHHFSPTPCRCRKSKNGSKPTTRTTKQGVERKQASGRGGVSWRERDSKNEKTKENIRHRQQHTTQKIRAQTSDSWLEAREKKKYSNY